MYKQEIKIYQKRYILTYILPKGLSFCTFPVVRKSFKENKSFLCILSDRLFPKKDKLRDKNPPHHHHQKCPCRAVRCPYRLLRGALVRRYLDAMITEKCSSATIARLITKPWSWSWWIYCRISWSRLLFRPEFCGNVPRMLTHCNCYLKNHDWWKLYSGRRGYLFGVIHLFRSDNPSPWAQ